VGIEAVPGMDNRGAEELNEYAEQVEDVEQQIYERRRWLSDIGFFGMNFNWMISHLDGGQAFLAFGVLLPALSVIISIVWFRQRGLIQFNLRSRSTPGRPLNFDELAWPTRRAGQTSKSAISDATRASTAPLSIRKTDEVSA
jgi:hypothetical protein